MFRYTDKEIKEVLKCTEIVIDTREQKCGHIVEYFEKHNIPFCYEKLDVGDYTLKVQLTHLHKPYYLQNKCVIERKANLEEVSSNFTKGRERVEDEFIRAKGTVHFLIENASYEDLLLGKYNTQYDAKRFMATLKAFEARYNLHVTFMKDNAYSGDFIYKTLIYNLREQLKKGEI